MGHRKQLLSIFQLCVLLFAGVAAGLWAQDGVSFVSQSANRPQRTIRSDTPPSNLHSPLSTISYPLLTPEDLDRPLTVQYITRYSNAAGIEWINSIIRNGNIYLPFIQEEISRRGLPQELAFLPFIESGYVGTARSTSGAVGLWQFMMNSIGSLMKVNDLVDERRDFRKSTVAALQKLEENYRVLGNWPMALAAYNAGLGAAKQAVQRTKSDNYWVICDKKGFKNETVQYVPKFLAVSYILSNPRKYNVDYWPETVEWTAIKPGKQVSLEVIVSETKTDRNLLYRLNQELLYGITPHDKNYELVVPSAHADIIAGIFEREDLKLIQYYRYQIKYGDTLSVLAQHYGVSMDLIEQYNPGIKSRYLKIGETVIIPAFRQVNPYTGPALPLAAAGAAGNGFTGTHTITKGDTLWSVAIRYRVDPAVLARENNMELNGILSIGKVLKVPIIE